jgi:AmmeMemoRadiSam system protein B
MTTPDSIRPPAVAGTFYAGDAEALRRQVAECLGAEREDKPFLAAVVPHAGLMYSGAVAGALYARVTLPQRFIILCPNHTGRGAVAAINLAGKWRTPLGDAAIDGDLAAELMAECDLLDDDTRAHEREHSLEVQLPFLQELSSGFTFVPICLALPSFEDCARLGEAIARVVERHPRGSIAILSSSDLNHYEDQTTTLRKDQRAIDAMLNLDAADLWNRVRGERISMCGYIPTCTTIEAVRALGATNAQLVRHATSGDVSGDYKAVVGYCAIVIS